MQFILFDLIFNKQKWIKIQYAREYTKTKVYKMRRVCNFWNAFLHRCATIVLKTCTFWKIFPWYINFQKFLELPGTLILWMNGFFFVFFLLCACKFFCVADNCQANSYCVSSLHKSMQKIFSFRNSELASALANHCKKQRTIKWPKTTFLIIMSHINPLLSSKFI